MYIQICFETPWLGRVNYQLLSDKGVCNRKQPQSWGAETLEIQEEVGARDPADRHMDGHWYRRVAA